MWRQIRNFKFLYAHNNNSIILLSILLLIFPIKKLDVRKYEKDPKLKLFFSF